MPIVWMVLCVVCITQVVGSTPTSKRRRRGSDEWVPAVRDNICPWALCKYVCNGVTSCDKHPPHFEEQKEPDRMPRTCYAYIEKGEGAEENACEDGPKEDLCACITDGPRRRLQIGYGEDGEGKGKPANDGINTLCRSSPVRSTYECPTTIQPDPTTPTTMLSTTTTEPQTTSRTPTSVPYSTTNRAPTGRTTTLTPSTRTGSAMTTAQATGSYTTTVPLTDGGGTMANTTPGPVTSDEGALFYIQYWLPAVLGLILVILLVALFRRRQRSKKAPSQVNPMAHTGSNGVYYSPCSDSGPLEVDPNRDGVTGDTAVGLVLNPAYEQNISGTELERSGDFFCPAMSDTPNHFKVKGRAQSPGKVDAIHGNPPALLGNFNVGFSEGNYNPVAAGTSCDLPSARGSRYEPVAVRRSGEHLPRPDAGYDNPDEFVMPENKPAPPMHPWKSKKQQQGDGYEEPPVGDERSPGDGAHAPITYEIPEISPGLPTSPNTDTSYEVASIDKAAPRNTLPKYAGVDMSNKATNQDNGEKSPGADSGYEAAIVPPGNTPSSAGAPVRYNYAYAYVSPTGCPPGMPIKANQYNVLQTPCKEDDGEYSMLNRNKGGGYQTSTTAPIIMPANVYNSINIASQK